ncbi:2-C-methyl-D-erythritol 2,4-cyclodiphosphate synthase [Marinilongibacter aquaticus]|uniref:2-C-methyl-D-erythritol 2,4-cyclodiphosphate synthase n=1 Tax=Marinilongibacter aquaticus TaxID=2975157 RepID=UPI0021BD9BE3|nr:2-C-methyl-D-erythritol 2,4-cyclodiphosphate synthase [Marinilongibacter aquaticus]UBM59078.1 2-C-methyl-D-erythritol 2,4-cyclodiphosphate synthase [Marinilongibacter aquaticus]
MKIKIGHGYDVHQLAEGYKLTLGGIEIPHHKGSMGHSDADVLLHALCDAILGALSLGDIGQHFKNTDPQWKGADSKIFLREVNKMILDRGWKVGNVDSTLILESPKIGKYVPEMKRAIAQCLEIAEDCVSIKATTSETMGFVGKGEGLEAHAVCLLFGAD